jgi:hypothetical protein
MQAAKRLGQYPRDLRVLILLNDIPVERIGRAWAMSPTGFEKLKKAAEDLDRRARARGMASATVAS